MARKSLREQIEVEKIAKPSRGRGRKRTLAAQIEKTCDREYVLDLRIHTPSSLGYIPLDFLDTAPALVRLAKAKGLDIIAVTDYYSGEFIDRVKKAAKTNSLTVIPGTVIRCILGSCKDVILTCLFPENYDSKSVAAFLEKLNVPSCAAKRPDYILTQPFEEILSVIEEFNGIAIPSTMDKTPNRLAVIPLLVEKYGFRVFDLAYFPDSTVFFKKNWPETKFHLLSFSSANALAQIGTRSSTVLMQERGFTGLKDIASRVML